MRDVEAEELQVRRVAVLVVVRCLDPPEPVHVVRQVRDEVLPVGVCPRPRSVSGENEEQAEGAVGVQYGCWTLMGSAT